MTREALLEEALAVAVKMLQDRCKKANAFPPVLTPLQNVVDKMQTTNDISIIHYAFEET